VHALTGPAQPCRTPFVEVIVMPKPAIWHSNSHSLRYRLKRNKQSQTVLPTHSFTPSLPHFFKLITYLAELFISEMTIDLMQVSQYLKIAPLVLLVSACSPSSDPQKTTPGPGANAVSSLNANELNDLSSSVGSVLSNDDASSNPITEDGNSTSSIDETAGALSADEIDVLSASVGGVLGAPVQPVIDQTDAVQPVAVQPEVTQPDVVQPEVTQPEVVQPTEATPSVNAQEPTTISSDAPPQATTPEPPASDAVVRIPRTDRPNAPQIDGATLDYITGEDRLDGEWRFAVQRNSFNELLAINRYMFGEPGADNNSAAHQWAALHDGEFLYLLVLSDDAGEHHQDTNEARKPWKDDSVEIFIDGNNSRLTEYDGVDDFHITINLLSPSGTANASYIADPKIRQSDVSATLPSDLIFAAGPEKGPTDPSSAQRGRKDIYEIRIKLSELNIEVGAPFGIEVQINDDDDGGNRDAKWGWYHPSGDTSDNDYTWQNPSFMGTAVLID